ncbi:hypothetical protein SDC9_118151 [bioreactor metagenome]|uniref:Uncharacterized protein n=1 Tax=bioreactor metagenome TaxID=1076179 RepID=A0A645C1I0_9ZZZZ
MALAQPLQPGGGHAELFAVQRPNGGQAQPPTAHGGGSLHRLQPRRPLRLFRKPAPHRPSRISPGGFQRRGNSHQSVFPFAALPLYPVLREQLPQPLHHKGGPKPRPVDIGNRIADGQPVRGLGKGRIEVLQLHVELLHTGGGQTNPAGRKLLPVLVVQHAAPLGHGGQHMVVGPQ